MADGADQRALDSATSQAPRYSAFISYSRADTAFVKRLHHQLETYCLPRRLAVGSGARLARSRRLKPVFRDGDEFTASYDLTTAVRNALAQSEWLIVICSPNAVKSDWVGREIALFRSLHGDRHILAALIEGTPQTAFHAELYGVPGGPPIQPLAADFRPESGGRKLALLKLIAAVEGAELDELVQRDANRQIRRVATLATGAVASVAVVAGLGVIALTQKAEAEAQRQRAGGMGAFMLTDLRKGLKAAGRLDLQMAVNQATLNYYRGQDLSRLPPDDLVQRAAALQALGEDYEKRGDLASAREQFEEAGRTTGALLAARPHDPKRIFAHAQSKYWIGFINWRAGDGAAAKAGFDGYAALAAQLVHIDPRNDAWLMETAYAANNLGMLALRQAGNPAEAQRQFSEALRVRKLIAQHKPGDPALMSDIANAYAWLADSQRLNGDLRSALASRETQRTILAGLLAESPRNVELQADMLGHDLAVARIEAEQRRFGRAISRLEAGREAALALTRSDPENSDFAKQARMFELFEVQTWLAMPSRSRPPVATIASVLGDCTPPTRALADDEIGDFCAILKARSLVASGDQTGASAAMAPVRRHANGRRDVLTAHWGLNLNKETQVIQVADQVRGTR